LGCGGDDQVVSAAGVSGPVDVGQQGGVVYRYGWGVIDHRGDRQQVIEERPLSGSPRGIIVEFDAGVVLGQRHCWEGDVVFGGERGDIKAVAHAGNQDAGVEDHSCHGSRSRSMVASPASATWAAKASSMSSRPRQRSSISLTACPLARGAGTISATRRPP